MKLVFDIETTRRYEKLSHAPDREQKAWDKVAKKFPELTPEESYIEKGGLFPEYGQIVCISAMNSDTKKVKSFIADPDESWLLDEFREYIFGLTDDFPSYLELIGHRVKYFDVPYINVRFAANHMPLIPEFKTNNTKPWELNIKDTWEIWKGGIFGSSQAADLESICNLLNIDSPKDDISGEDVANVYFTEGEEGLERIKNYCEKDVLATAELFNKLHSLNMI